jgi:hypothetical protein
MIGHGHANAQVLCFIASGNDAAIVITEHNNGLLPEVRPEQALAGAVKAVAINYGNHSGD